MVYSFYEVIFMQKNEYETLKMKYDSQTSFLGSASFIHYSDYTDYGDKYSEYSENTTTYDDNDQNEN